MLPLISAEIYSLSRRPACRVLALVGVAVVAFLYLVLAILLAQSDGAALNDAGIENFHESLSFGNSHIFGFGIVQFIASILGIILMAVAITSEYAWRTVITLVTWSGERGRLLVAKMAVVLGFLGLGVGVGWLTAALGSIALGLIDGSLTLDGVGPAYAGTVLASWGRTSLTVAAYAMLAAALSAPSRNLALGIGLALIIRFLEPVGAEFLHLLPGDLETFRPLLLAPNVDALLAANGTLDSAARDASAEPLPGTLQAALYLIAFCLLTGASAVYSFTRRDIDV